LKSISSYIVSLLLITFSYQIGGHYLLSDINIFLTEQLETPLEESSDENEKESEEEDVKHLTLHSLSDQLNNLMRATYARQEEQFRNVVWLEQLTPPPKV
jgi:hypothetical protein